MIANIWPEAAHLEVYLTIYFVFIYIDKNNKKIIKGNYIHIEIRKQNDESD